MSSKNNSEYKQFLEKYKDEEIIKNEEKLTQTQISQLAQVKEGTINFRINYSTKR